MFNLKDNKKDGNNDTFFVRIVTSVLMIFIASLIIINFFFTEPRFVITKEILFCFLFLVLLCLYDKFDNFTIGKLFSMKKEVKKVNLENERLKDENFKLISNFINFSNNHNNQSNVFNMMASDGQSVTAPSEVVSTLDSIDGGNNDKINDNDIDKEKNNKQDMKPGLNISKYFRLSEKVLIDQYVEKNNIQGKLEYQLRVFNNESFNDIIKKDIRFDAYINTENENIFIETSVVDAFMFSDRLYSLLTFVKKYEEITKIKSKLVFLVPNYDREFIDFYSKTKQRSNINDRIKRSLRCLKEKYSPAINNKLLEVEVIDINKQKLDQLLEENKKIV